MTETETETAATPPPLAGPYPGLRPFRREETPIFFGRDEQVDQLLEKLQQARFLGIVGESGCGKSSLILAGLIPALESGFLATAGADWRVATMRPGSGPMRRLAEALLDFEAVPPGKAATPDDLAFLLATLRRGPLGLVDALSHPPPAPGENVLLVVDQFEEIFRFRTADDPAAADGDRTRVDRDEATAFVALLLATARSELPVYVVLTMRSDYLGNCAVFDGLPEALNRGQFLTPRLDHDQRREAIEASARVFGGEVERALVTRLLNDMDSAPDQLPLMQHALMRLWSNARAAAPGRPGGAVLTLADYDTIGGLADALSRHADEAYGALAPEQRPIAEVLFRALSERGAGRRDTRRPVELGVVAAVADVAPERVAAVVEAFRAPGLNFLMPPRPEPLPPTAKLDISHESLIRRWGRLRRWVEREVESADFYRYLLQAARNQDRKGGEHWAGEDLNNALAWRDGLYPRPADDEPPSPRPNAPWADRYGGDFALAMRFIEESERERRREQQEAEEYRRQLETLRQHEITAKEQAAELKRVRKRMLVAFALSATTLGAMVLAVVMWFAASKSGRLAEGRRQEAILSAENEAKSAVMARENAEKAGNESRLARSLLLAGQLQGLSGSFPQRALLLAVEALRDAKDPRPDEAVALENALRSTLSSSGGYGMAGHRGPVAAIAFSPDGKRAVTGSEDGTARLWEVTPEGPKSPPHALNHGEAIQFVAFSPDGRRLVTATDLPTRVAIPGPTPPAPAKPLIRVWDLDRPATPGVRLELGGSTTVLARVVTPQGRLIVVGDDGVNRWDLSGREPKAERMKLRLGLAIAALSPDGRLVASWETGLGLTLWDLSANEAEALVSPLPEAPETVRSLAFRPDGRALAAVSSGSPPRVWFLDEQQKVAQSFSLAGNKGPGDLVAFSPDNVTILTASSATREVSLWRPDPAAKGLTGAGTYRPTPLVSPPWEIAAFAFALTSEARLPGWQGAGTYRPTPLVSPPWEIAAFAFSPDGRLAAARGDDRQARLYRLNATDAPPDQLRGHEGTVLALAFGPKGHPWLLTGSNDATARLHDMTDGGPSLADPALWSVAGSGFHFLTDTTPDGRRLAVETGDAAWTWDLADRDPAGPRPRRLPAGVDGPDAPTFMSLALDPGGRWLAGGRVDGTIRLWDLAAGRPGPPPVDLKAPEPPLSGRPPAAPNRTRRLVRLRAAAMDPVMSKFRWLEFSPGGRWLVAVRQDLGAVLLYDPAKGPAASPRVKRLVVPGTPRKAVRKVSMDPVREDYFSNLAFDPSGRRLAVSVMRRDDADAPSGEIYLFDLQAADPTATVRRVDQPGNITALAFDREGRRLAVGAGAGRDGAAVQLWDLSAADPAHAVRTLFKTHRIVRASLAFDPVVNFVGLGISPDGRRLAASIAGRILVWDLDGPLDGAIRDADGPGAFASRLNFSPDSRWLLETSPDAVRLHDLGGGNLGAAPIVLPGQTAGGSRSAFSPDSRWLATLGADQTARVWDLARPDLLRDPDASGRYGRALQGGPQFAFADVLTFSPDGRRLAAAGSGDGLVRLWIAPGTDPAPLIDLAGRTAGRNLSKTEWSQYLPNRAYRETFPGLPAPPDVATRPPSGAGTTIDIPR